MPRRRQTTTFIGDIPDALSQSTYIGDSERRFKSQSTSTTNLLTRSTPDLSLELLIGSTTIPTTQNSPSVITAIRPETEKSINSRLSVEYTKQVEENA